MTTHLTISLLGPFQVTLNGEPVTQFGSDTARALLAYLALHPGVPHRRDALAGLLWPDYPDSRARHNLRAALSRLRTAIGDRATGAGQEPAHTLLQVERQTILFPDDARCTIDASAMRQALAAIRTHEHSELNQCDECASLLQEAADLYRGEFLAGFSLDSAPFEEWMVVEREGLHWQALEALSALAAYHEGQGDYEAAIACARRQVELEPWREDAYRQWMRALASSGRRGAALALYEACQRVLLAELGVQPEQATVALYDRIRAGAFAPKDVPTPAAMVAPTSAQVPAHVEVSPGPRIDRDARAGAIAGVDLGGERRTVSLLRADVLGSDELLARVGTEEWALTISDLLRALGTAVHRYGGAVDRYLEHGIEACFGATAAHEDDPERAVLAALEMHEAFVAALSALGAAERGAASQAKLGLSVGVHTGEAVLVSLEEGGSARAVGEALAAVSHVPALAGRGEVRVSANTYRLVAPLFKWAPLRAAEVEDEDAGRRPLAHKALASKGRGLPGLHSPLVGRDGERDALLAAIENLRVGVGGIATLVGEAGLGKSRLVAEVRAEVEGREPRRVPRLQWVEGRCLSYTTGVAYQLWLDMLRGLLGTAADASPEAARSALGAWLSTLCTDHMEDVYPFLAQMMSLPLDAGAQARLSGLDAQGVQVLTFDAVETVLECTTKSGPLVVVCEDLHWADATSLALLDRMLGLTDRLPLLIVAVFRPQRSHPCWAFRETAARLYAHRHTDLWLQPLSAGDGERLVGNLLRIEDLSEELRAQILDRGGGNPFYVEEILRSLIDEAVIAFDEGSGRWQARQDVTQLTVPETLQGVLAARIDGLPQGARQMLQLASVIGRVFSRPLLAAIAAGPGLDEALAALQRAQMVHQRVQASETQYAFKHVLTQAAAYDTLLRRARRALHLRVAEALERLYPARIEEQLGLLAHHWEQAGDAARAVGYLRRAGEQAATLHANAEAVGYLSRALNLVPADTGSAKDLAGRYAMLLRREAIYDLLGEREAQCADLGELDQTVDALDDGSLQAVHRRAEVALRWADLHTKMYSDPALIADSALKAVRLARQAGDAGMEAAGHLHWGNGLFNAEDVSGAWAHWEEALAISRAAGRRPLEGAVLRVMGMHAQGQFEKGKVYSEQNLQICREIGNRMEEGKALNSLAFALGFLHELSEAQSCAEQGLQLCRLTGNRVDETYSLYHLGEILTELGMYAASERRLEPALDRFRRMGGHHGEGVVLVNRARNALFVGDDEASLAYSQRALEVGKSINHPFIQVQAQTIRGDALAGKARASETAAGQARTAYQAALALCEGPALWPHWGLSARSGLARLALAQGELTEAETHAQKLLKRIEADPKLYGPYGPLQIYLDCYHVLAALQDPRAEQVLEAARELLQAWAGQIDDRELRRSFLENVPYHREILELWHTH